jgi:hypothetical protein
MKIIVKILLVFVILFISAINVNAWTFDSLLWGETPAVHIDCEDQDCNIQTGIDVVKDSLRWVETDRTFSEYVQDLTVYVLTFVSIIAVIYIIYAWFRILTWAWNEETLKKQKMTVLYVVLWILLIWLAYPIVTFILQVLSSEPV